jgi:hypothetical protein
MQSKSAFWTLLASLCAPAVDYAGDLLSSGARHRAKATTNTREDLAPWFEPNANGVCATLINSILPVDGPLEAWNLSDRVHRESKQSEIEQLLCICDERLDFARVALILRLKSLWGWEIQTQISRILANCNANATLMPSQWSKVSLAWSNGRAGQIRWGRETWRACTFVA